MKDRELLAGIDWASETHSVCVVDGQGEIRARFNVAHRAKPLAGMAKRLVRLRVSAVAIERPDGPLVETLLDAGMRVYVIAPRKVKALRERYCLTGAKSDPGDAYVLADVLRTDLHRFTPLSQDSPETKVLRALTRVRKSLVVSRVGIVNQLRAQLELCFPGALGLFSELDSPTNIAFLRRYPTSLRARRLTEARLAAFLKRRGYPGRKSAAELLAHLRDAPTAGISQAEAEGRAQCVLALLDAIETINTRIHHLEAEIAQRLDQHQDAGIFTSLPHAGRGVRAATLLAEIGDVRARFPDEESLAALAGVSPVTRASGKLTSVKFRWACDKRLRHAVLDFAEHSRFSSAWAAALYAKAINSGKRHPHAIRILARAWVRVLWRMWQEREAYDASRHGGAVMLRAA